MNEYQVYKKIRKRATILGMPSNNFYIMCCVDVGVFLTALGGMTIIKAFYILIIWAIAFILAKFTFNKQEKPTKINDYKRR